ncbi:heterokaryon incompatibility protein-domain-containing protein [Echria macrotheca]|uniref:Heterokaryon incompatibility protein-domain-containing protein n=1 Tax=Echria macrotheca TaxID=438768 RepID=A0AAJ0B5F6_9PEZI|nr:heterokaryon incompatibility protein-domain-containing protein [Echria macrotheca]
MRLLQRQPDGDFRLTEDLPNGSIPPYAILSHTWGKEEILLKDLADGTAKNKLGYDKIRFCGKQAALDGLKFFWVDTCCIDKSSSAELTEAINSMFHWYREAAKCYVYLTDVTTHEGDLDDQEWASSFRASRWFTRGWTLQELLAPKSVEFFSRDGARLGDKESLEQHIQQATKIPPKALRGYPLSEFSISDRMIWIQNRVTTREEDKAYSLFGIFDVQLPLLYGEGERKAFRRLRDEIARVDEDASRALSTRPWSSRMGKEGEILRCLNKSPYRDRKDLNPERVPGTCDWFVYHERFAEWKDSTSSKMLWVSADPGCGKSVLTKYLVDSVLPATQSRTVCYFFFKDGFSDQTSVVSALCCILHQLFTQKRNLLSDAIIDQFDTGGETFTSSFSSLWQTLLGVAKDENSGEIICLLDAIDECEAHGWRQLAKALCDLYGTPSNFNLKFLLTSRPYDEIRRSFHLINLPGLPVIHLSGENDVELEKISKEIGIFIAARTWDIASQLALTQTEQGILLAQMMRIPHRTYLWVHLTLDLIESAVRVDGRRIIEITSELPATVDEAYDRILSRSGDPDSAVKILHTVVAAARPLTLREMSLALALEDGNRPYKDVDLPPEDRFRRDLRQMCGLFVTIIDSKVYLLHQTAREFLVCRPSNDVPPEHLQKKFRWKYSLRSDVSHGILAHACIRYLQEFEMREASDDLQPDGSENHLFLDYSAKNWAVHVRELPTETQRSMLDTMLQLCDTNSSRFKTWFTVLLRSIPQLSPLKVSRLLWPHHSLAWISQSTIYKIFTKPTFLLETPAIIGRHYPMPQATASMALSNFY